MFDISLEQVHQSPAGL